MDWKTLEGLGFTSVGGAVDRGNKNYGRVTKDGVALTPEGVDLVEELLAPKRARRTKTHDIQSAVAFATTSAPPANAADES